MDAKNKWIKEVKSSLDGIKPAEVNPYLYSKILNRLSLRKQEYVPAKLVWTMCVSIALLIFLNLIVFKSYQSKAQNKNEEIQQLSEQFQLTSSNLINYN